VIRSAAEPQHNHTSTRTPSRTVVFVD
jgi:hypothetical protein